MKQKYLWMVCLIMISGLLSGCVQLEKNQEATTTAEDIQTMDMEAVDNNGTKPSHEKKKAIKSTNQNDKQTIVSKEKEDHTQLLEKYGEAYANFKNLNHRNEQLKDLMTEECIKMNGIDIKTGNALGSEGKVTAIYQNAQEEYAVLLDCIQNGSPIRILLLAKVKDGKIAEMTYNTLKQEY
ncbi:TPA: EF0163 family protein [Enterococcus hirae]